MTDDERVLLAGIRATPDDDLPRLVYADWLEEHDRPERAEFIRVECEAARADHSTDDYPRLLRHSDRLRATHGAEWFGPLATGELAKIIITRRGFVDSASLSADFFALRADEIFAHAPLLRGLFSVGDGDWQAFFNSPRFAAVRELSFDEGVFDGDAAEQLAECNNATRLIELNLDYQWLEPDVMSPLSETKLTSLERIVASSCNVGDESAIMLFQSERLRNLRVVDLGENSLTYLPLQVLAGNVNFGELEELILCHNRITSAGVEALARAPHLAGLRKLNLHGCPIGPEGGRAILASRCWDGLTELNLTRCGVGNDVVAELRQVYGEHVVLI